MWGAEPHVEDLIIVHEEKKRHRSVFSGWGRDGVTSDLQFEKVAA